MITMQSLYFALAILFGLAVWRAWYNGREGVAWFIWTPLAIIATFVAVGDSWRQLFFGIVIVVIVIAIFMMFRQLIARWRSEVTDLSADDTVRLGGAR